MQGAAQLDVGPDGTAPSSGPSTPAWTDVSALCWLCQNDRHIVCRDHRWSIGLSRITFKHVYVVGVVQTKGYVAKWLPLLEVDSSALAMDA